MHNENEETSLLGKPFGTILDCRVPMSRQKKAPLGLAGHWPVQSSAWTSKSGTQKTHDVADGWIRITRFEPSLMLRLYWPYTYVYILYIYSIVYLFCIHIHIFLHTYLFIFCHLHTHLNIHIYIVTFSHTHTRLYHIYSYYSHIYLYIYINYKDM